MNPISERTKSILIRYKIIPYILNPFLEFIIVSPNHSSSQSSLFSEFHLQSMDS